MKHLNPRGQSQLLDVEYIPVNQDETDDAWD